MKACLLAALVAVAAADGPPVDVGTVDRKVPTPDELKVPKSDKDLPAVELRHVVKGKAKAGDKRAVFVLVCPVGSKESGGTWWVQQEPDRRPDGFVAEAQFGEDGGGAGEVFAVLGVATDRKWETGEQVTKLPADAGYSKVTFVKRAK